MSDGPVACFSHLSVDGSSSTSSSTSDVDQSQRLNSKAKKSTTSIKMEYGPMANVFNKSNHKEILHYLKGINLGKFLNILFTTSALILPPCVDLTFLQQPQALSSNTPPVFVSFFSFSSFSFFFSTICKVTIERSPRTKMFLFSFVCVFVCKAWPCLHCSYS